MSEKYNHFYESLKDVAKRLRANLDSDRPSISAEIVWAYQSETVLKALAMRLAAGEKLERVVSLIPDIVMLVRRVFFQFAPLHGFDVESAGVLAEVGDNNEVARIIDPFLLSQERQLLLSRERQSTLFVQGKGAFPLVINMPIFPSDQGDDRAGQKFEAFIVSQGLLGAFGRLIVGFGDTVGSGDTTLTLRDVKTETQDGSRHSDSQTDQRGSRDPKAAEIFGTFRIDPTAVFPGSAEESTRE